MEKEWGLTILEKKSPKLHKNVILLTVLSQQANVHFCFWHTYVISLNIYTVYFPQVCHILQKVFKTDPILGRSLLTPYWWVLVGRRSVVVSDHGWYV